MTKSGLIVLLCFNLASGCAVFDGTEVTTEPQSAPPPVIESKTESIPTAIETAPVERRPAAARSFTRDDMRRMQLRLREAGFDPGPIDGVAGAKTKAAFGRLQNGCSSASAVIDQWAGTGSPNNIADGAKVPNSQETRTIQTQLRIAGFNPGPVDGIFGNKTRSLLAQLRSSCPMVPEFAQMLQPTVVTSHIASTAQGPQNSSGKLQLSRLDSAKQPILPQVAHSQEEIRILQLQSKDAGFDPGPFDGIMGPKTKAALQQYQASRKGKATTMISGFGKQY